MKLRTTLSIIMFLSTGATQALTISCDVNSQLDMGGSDITGSVSHQAIEYWSPKKQVHVVKLKNMTALYKNFDFQAKLDSVDKQRLRWEYVVDVNNEKKNDPYEVHFKFIYVRKAQKLITRVDFGADYMDFEGVSKKCIES